MPKAENFMNFSKQVEEEGKTNGKKWSVSNVSVYYIYLILNLLTFASIFIAQKHFRIILNL